MHGSEIRAAQATSVSLPANDPFAGAMAEATAESRGIPLELPAEHKAMQRIDLADLETVPIPTARFRGKFRG